RRLADEIAQSDEQLSLKQIAAAQSANNFQLQMGQESLDQWKQNAQAEADAKLNAELTYLDRKLAADQGSAAAFQKDLDQIRAAYQNHTDQLAQIDQQYVEKKRQADSQALQDKIQSDNAEYQEAASKLDAEVRDHQTSAAQRAQAEIALATTIEQQELAMFEATHQNLIAGTTAYEEAMKQRQAIADAFNHRVEAADNQITAQETQQWTTLGNSIKSSFNSAIDEMVFRGKSFQTGMIMIADGVIKAFFQMAENIAENWIESQITALFTTKATQTATAMGQISDAAGVAGANAVAATAGIPIVGPAMAGGAGAAAAAEAMSFSGMLSLAVGAWEMRNDAIAQLHRGEMVVPQSFAAGLRAHGGAMGGEVNMHYAPTINAREPATLSQMLTRESGEMLSWLNRQFRNGALRAA
ncbi:MAG TPA: hypothetical protein VMF67_02475, partial [Rhizomicrobium sp.]|nr:hypothetical protein [Rhizomicrobium sp.]